MAIYLVAAGATPPGSGFVETVDGLVLDWALVLAASSYLATVGDATNSAFTITHNLGTRDLAVQVRRAVTPYEKVDPQIAFTTTDTITVTFASIPLVNEYRVAVQPN